MPIGELIAEIGGRAILEFVGAVVEPPARWLGYHLVKYVFLLGQREVRHDGWVVFVVGLAAWIAIVLAGYEMWGRWPPDEGTR